MPKKFPIGSRVGAQLDAAGTSGPREVAMKVLGYDGLKEVIVETLEPVGSWATGYVTLMPAISLTQREEVKYIPGEPEDENGSAIGWMELGGVSVALTRDSAGVLLISIERAPDTPEDAPPVRVQFAKMHNGTNLWEGDI